jgi:hypothetical protein
MDAAFAKPTAKFRQLSIRRSLAGAMSSIDIRAPSSLFYRRDLGYTSDPLCKAASKAPKAIGENVLEDVVTAESIEKTEQIGVATS